MADISFRKKLLESLLGNVGTMLMNLLLPFVVTTIYGTNILGVYTYNLSIITMFIFLASLGLSTGLIYFIPRTGKKYVTSTLLTNLVASTVLIGVGYLVFKTTEMKMMIPLLWPLSAELVFQALFQSKHHIKEYFYINLLAHQGIKISVAWILGSLLAPTMANLVLATYIGVLISLIVYALLNKDMFGPLHFSSSVIKYALPLSVSNMLYVVMINLDRIMIGRIHNEANVAIYAVAANFAMIPSIFLAVLNTIFPPIISKMYHEGQIKELKAIYEKSVKVLTVISSITIALIILFRIRLLGFYGDEYLAGASALIMISIGQLVNASVGSVWFTISMTGHSNWSMYGNILTFIINISLNLILIPVWGISGAAFATMISTAFSNILGFFLVKGIFKKALKSM